MSTTPENIDRIIAAVRAAASAGERDLWGYDEIAAYSKYERNYVVNTIVCLPGFPRPVNVLHDAGRKAHPRYVASEVMDWFEARRG